MELRHYWSIIFGRWPVVVITFVVVTIVAFGATRVLPQAKAPYQATVSLAVRPQEQPRSDSFYTYDEYYAYVASEYLADDMISIAQDHDFLTQVNKRLQAANQSAPGASIEGKKAHRIITLTATSTTEQGAINLAGAAANEIIAPLSGQSYWNRFSAQNPAVSIVDPPTIVVAPAGGRSSLDLVVRALLGLILGIGLAFFLDYLDDTVRPNEVERLIGKPVLAGIPTTK